MLTTYTMSSPGPWSMPSSMSGWYMQQHLECLRAGALGWGIKTAVRHVLGQGQGQDEPSSPDRVRMVSCWLNANPAWNDYWTELFPDQQNRQNMLLLSFERYFFSGAFYLVLYAYIRTCCEAVYVWFLYDLLLLTVSCHSYCMYCVWIIFIWGLFVRNYLEYHLINLTNLIMFLHILIYFHTL